MKRFLKTVAELIHSLIFCVGCWTLYDFASARQPAATRVALTISFTTFGGAFLWMITVRPFLEGLREEKKR
jgi:hypothetical protein